jgi:hypothetical protein
MLSGLPVYISVVFVLTALLTLFFLWKVSSSKMAVIVMAGWLALQGILAYTGFYLNTSDSFPRIIWSLIPPFGLIIFMLVTKRGTKFTRRLKLKTLHLLHIVRIPTELCLYWLSVYQAVPELMTFRGDNFDIVTGFTALMLYFTSFKRRAVRSVNVLFAWNIIGLVMLGNAVIVGLLSIPGAFQHHAHDQPNVAVLYFPFVWLYSFIAMSLLFSHLVMIKRLMIK